VQIDRRRALGGLATQPSSLSSLAGSSLELFWLGFTGIAAAAAAIVAAVQIWLTRADGKRQAAFEHIRGVEERLERALHVSAGEAQAAVLAFYRNTGDWTLATTWLRGRLKRDDTTLQFIIELQTACGDPTCFEYLKGHLGRAWKGSLPITTTGRRT